MKEKMKRIISLLFLVCCLQFLRWQKDYQMIFQ